MPPRRLKSVSFSYSTWRIATKNASNMRSVSFMASNGVDRSLPLPERLLCGFGPEVRKLRAIWRLVRELPEAREFVRDMIRVAKEGIEVTSLMIGYHVTTPAKLARYQATGAILPPVRFWIHVASARAWGAKTQRNTIVRIRVENAYPLPDHRPRGHAWWSEDVVRHWEIVT